MATADSVLPAMQKLGSLLRKIARELNCSHRLSTPSARIVSAFRNPLYRQIQKGKAEFAAHRAAQMLRRFHNHDFQGRSNVGIQQVTAMSGAIRLADDDVSMELRIALVVLGDVAHERHQLDLLMNRNFLVV